MDEKVLIVDDDANLLAGYERNLRNRFRLFTAEGPARGLWAVKELGPFMVVVADYKMPLLDGMQFLNAVRADSPDTVRIMLTGYADLSTVLDAINKGGFFRFLLKPCPMDDLKDAIQAGIEQHRLLMAERDLVEKTLKGTIKILTDTLSMVNPAAFSHSIRVSGLANRLAVEVGIEKPWEVECAAMLSQIGCVTLAGEIMHKKYYQEKLTPDEERMFSRHPQAGRHLLANIPRLERVAEAIAYQEKHFDGSGLPSDDRRGKDIPVAARLLKVVLDFDLLTAGRMAEERAIEEMRGRTGFYDPEMLAALEAELRNRRLQDDLVKWVIREVRVRDLGLGMRLVDDVKSVDGMLLVPRGFEVTYACKARLMNFAELNDVVEPVKVREKLPPVSPA
ncbi:MAG: response regulator [Verrucomicrobiae bacterium]|nr:response regulator [Verrucomicrobiae bacterium]